MARFNSMIPENTRAKSTGYYIFLAIMGGLMTGIILTYLAQVVLGMVKLGVLYWTWVLGAILILLFFWKRGKAKRVIHEHIYE